MNENNQNLANILASFAGKSYELIPILQKVQHEFGYLSENSMRTVAKFLRIAEAQVYSVATFYSQFRFTAKGKNHIMACRGTACHVKGAGRLRDEIKKLLNIEHGQVTNDGMFSLETVACIGACGLAPAMIINGQTYGRLTSQKVAEIITDLQKKSA